MLEAGRLIGKLEDRGLIKPFNSLKHVNFINFITFQLSKLSKLSNFQNHYHPLDPKNPIQHIPTILYSWRKTKKSTANEKNIGKVKNYAYTKHPKIIQKYINKTNKMFINKVKASNTQYHGLVNIKITDEKLLKKIKSQLFLIYPLKNIY